MAPKSCHWPLLPYKEEEVFDTLNEPCALLRNRSVNDGIHNPRVHPLSRNTPFAHGEDPVILAIRLKLERIADSEDRQMGFDFD
jgi:hypothetical protein